MQPTTSLRRTPFYDFHKAAGARLVEFAGFEMPVRYSGDVREHQAVRGAAGLFDVSHMGEFEVRGAGAVEFVNRLVTNDVASAEVGQAVYSAMCQPDGGIVDDLLIYRYADHLMLVVNASNIASDFAWMRQSCPAGVDLVDRSEEVALLAVQGPRAPEVLRRYVPDAVLDLGYYRFATGRLFGAEATLSRTGYTGEDGFELYFHPRDAARVWEGLMSAGRAVGLEPVGLGARDTLRLEMGYMLYGNDIDRTTTPLEAGLGWTVKWSKGPFVGREALLEQKERGLARRMVGIALEGRRIPRHGMALEAEGRAVGAVTSGSFGPSLDRPIGMGYVESARAGVGQPLEVCAGETRLPARIVARPFYARGSHR